MRGAQKTEKVSHREVPIFGKRRPYIVQREARKHMIEIFEGARERSHSEELAFVIHW